jgi:UDP-galactopyranose mutase
VSRSTLIDTLLDVSSGNSSSVGGTEREGKSSCAEWTCRYRPLLDRAAALSNPRSRPPTVGTLLAYTQAPIFFFRKSLIFVAMRTVPDAFVERRMSGRPAALICLSHLRWNFFYQRPQNLMTRFAADRRVFYVEEPVAASGPVRLVHTRDKSGVEVVVPHTPSHAVQPQVLRGLIDQFLLKQNISSYCLWYYTPMALEWTNHLSPLATVYDCMDDLSGFKGAPPRIKEWESELFRNADVVFTGGLSLFQAKRKHHENVYHFPSSIDVPHFARARNGVCDPVDQAGIPHVRIGYAGDIDERVDLELIAAVADARPDWRLVLLGPVVKIDPKTLPLRPNIHYLGMKSYQELPDYIGGWDVAMLPFARNDSTRFISPTKTPEYLAAGRPVVSTSTGDVVHSYGSAGVVHIADDAKDFVCGVEKALAEDPRVRFEKVDSLLSNCSWSKTWGRMAELLEDAVRRRTELSRSRRSVAIPFSVPSSNVARLDSSVEKGWLIRR